MLTDIESLEKKRLVEAFVKMSKYSLGAALERESRSLR